jgi:UDP-N-acetylmuramate--alanine ligase
LGAKIYIGHSAENVPENAKIVVSTAIKEDNVELLKAKELGLEILHRSDMLKILSQNCKKFIGFSGTHGKTTTSGMCAYILEKCGFNPSFAIGGIVPGVDTNAKSSLDFKNTYFVAELDESDGTILKYSPDFITINNIEADHFDFFKKGEDDVIKTFETFWGNLKDDAKIFLNVDDEGVLKLLEKNGLKNVVTYAIKNSAKYTVKNIELKSEGSSFDVLKNNELLGKVELIIPGEYNVINALAVSANLIELGLEFDDFKKHFKTFTGMGRRFQSVAKFKDIEIIDDYAHHPTEIAAVLEAAKNYAKERVVAIFQPHRYTRFQGLWEEFKNAFKNADVLVVTDVWSAGEDVIKGCESEDFATQTGCIYAKGQIKEASKEIYKILKPNDVVLTLGAGDITEMGKALEGDAENDC